MQHSRGPRPFTVDLHGHVHVPQIERLIADRPEKLGEREQQVRTMGAASVEHNFKCMLPAAGPKLVEHELRLADMDRMGIDVQLISPTPNQYYYWADRDLAQQLVKEQNEAIAAACDRYPRRLVGLGNLSWQHPELAIEQLEYAVRDLGLKGVEVSTTINGRELCDDAFARVWAKAEALECLVFIHPFGTTLGERVNQFYLQNFIGQPLETTVALSYLIFSGTLDRHPGLKLLAAHGGGYLPSYCGRSDHGFEVRPEARKIQHTPSTYLKRIWFDSLVYDPASLRRLIERVGPSQVVIGTDYPFDMGHYEVHELLGAVDDLSLEHRRAILGGNARELLGLRIEGEG